MTTEIPDVKVCDECEQELPLTSFHKHGTAFDGRQARCIGCASKRRKRAKKCAWCGVSKALTRYPENRLRPDGHGSWCTDCHDAEAHRMRHKFAEKRAQRLYATGLMTTEPAYSA